MGEEFSMTEAINSLRNIGLVGHGGAGKTSLAEALLFDAGTTNRLGKVDDGSSVMVRRKAIITPMAV